MEARGDTPKVWVDAPDLAEVVQRDGPFLTVVLATEARVDNASQRSQTRWRARRDELASSGVPEGALAGVDPLIPDAHLAGETLVVVATTEGVAHVSHGDGLPFRELGRWESLPVLAPLLELRQAIPAHVLVVADRRGADLTAVAQRGEVERSVDGDLHHARKVSAGGWSQRRYQERAENVWEHNAKEVAETVIRLAGRVEARLVALAGDVRAVQLLQDALGDQVSAPVQVLDGSRTADGSEGIDPDQLRAALAAVTAADDEAVLEKLDEELGQGDRATQGAAATVDALAAAQVEVLLVHDDLDGHRRAFFGPDPTAVALSTERLHDVGVAHPQPGRLVDVAIRSALGTGAGVRVVARGDRLPDGVAAILRWS